MVLIEAIALGVDWLWEYVQLRAKDFKAVSAVKLPVLQNVPDFFLYREQLSYDRNVFVRDVGRLQKLVDASISSNIYGHSDRDPAIDRFVVSLRWLVVSEQASSRVRIKLQVSYRG